MKIEDILDTVIEKPIEHKIDCPVSLLCKYQGHFVKCYYGLNKYCNRVYKISKLNKK